MAERSDDPFARRAAGDRPAAQPQRRPARPVSEDDPLVELARIVSGQSSFDDIVNSRPASSPAPQSSRPRDASFDLESELFNNPNGAYDPPVQQPARRTAAAPRAAESFQHLKLRGGNAQQVQWDNRTADHGYSDPYANTGYDRGAFGRRGDDHAAQSYEDDGYDEGYGTEEAGEGYDDGLAYDEDEGYDERPRRGRRALVLLGILGVLVLGGGIAAYALRGGDGGTSSDGPPIIAADQTPTKERPAAIAETEEPQNKLIYDRVAAEEPSEERLVLPEDEGIDDGPAPADGLSEGSREISRIILPGAPGDESSSPAVAGPAAAPAEPAQMEPAPPPGPRRVRTVIVRPDGTIISSDARPAEGDTAEPTPAPAAGGAPAPAASAPPAGPVETARAPEIPAPAPAPAELAPPSTEPEPQIALAPPASEPAQPAPPPARVEEPAVPISGGFVVQVSSQRSEDQARSAYRDLQRRYPSVLGGRPVDIARADLGDRGVYYRARVGPMGTREEAISLCEALKAAGGDCIVQRN